MTGNAIRGVGEKLTRYACSAEGRTSLLIWSSGRTGDAHGRRASARTGLLLLRVSDHER